MLYMIAIAYYMYFNGVQNSLYLLKIVKTLMVPSQWHDILYYCVINDVIDFIIEIQLIIKNRFFLQVDGLKEMFIEKQC